ncbi:hypothetical protein BB561_002409 [Smittium simulii]|uniref:SGNH hydrolase-type esterase domain-containing protein n=1 Tax=Smittium simulii TaxID=133385 RepID=A0A2T9YQT8_9FUNG|nr:hypothetical protein BB561_002409 [Smittium simulii]
MLSKISTFALLCIASYTVPVASKPHLVVFGDSFSDNGNIPNTENSLTLWKGHFSDGPVWNEYLAYFNDYTLINYAYGGATSNDTSVIKFTGTSPRRPSVPSQISNFTSTFGGKFLPEAITQDIAVVEVGTNDINFGIELIVNNTIDKENYSDSIVSNILESVDRIRNLGYRKILVTTVPNLKTSPFILDYSISGRENASNFINLINEKLVLAINKRAYPNNNSEVNIVDLDKILSLVTGQIGKELGIKVTDKRCYELADGKIKSICPNSNEYMFKDEIHPTTKVHSFIASVFAEIIKNAEFKIDIESTLPLIAKYDLANANSLSNFMYYSDSYQTGKMKIESYNILRANINTRSIINTHNRDAKPRKCNGYYRYKY